MALKHINTVEEYEEFKESNKVGIIDFWAPWCGPCKMLGPIFEEVAKDYDGKVEFIKIDVDENPDVAAQFNVMSIPSLFIVKGDEILDQTMGAMTKDQLKEFVDAQLE